MKPLTFAAMLLLAALSAAPAIASTYSGVYVFGDSLSDAGADPSAVVSLYKLLGGNCDPWHPCPPYYQGHYSNGKTAVEYLADSILPGGANSGNFFDLAIAGSTSGIGNYGDFGTQSTGGLLKLPGMAQQVVAYLSTNPVDSNALYVVWGGGNDLLTFSGTATQAAQNIATYVAVLAIYGAQNILVPNLPDMSKTPYALENGADVIAYAAAFTQTFNSTLSLFLDDLSGKLPSARITEFDTYSLFDTILQAPSAYGFTNVVDACVNLPSVCADPDSYLFWDSVHPTTRLHALAAEAMAETLASLDALSAANSFADTVVPLPGAALLFASGLLAVSGRRMTTRYKMRLSRPSRFV
ncbi:SGNH/GDSL hydrolase family protein [Methylomonas rhizoryzae]|uniref:SGNH/GDSL hydrolase family protein n=1 Tax=Methylomonas rhizoryzae TaxID=2608981 RepID=UPI00168074A8|nr:SGNH/GDSL hydrolase family protein [Methylomonas rhizoryzae]